MRVPIAFGTDTGLSPRGMSAAREFGGTGGDWPTGNAARPGDRAAVTADRRRLAEEILR